MAISVEARELLEEVLREIYASNAFPRVQEFRVAHERQRALIDELVEQGYLKPRRPERMATRDPSQDRYVLTSKGVLACTSEAARAAVAEFDTLLPNLQNAYRQRPGYTWQPLGLRGLLAVQPPTSYGRLPCSATC